MRMHAGTCMGLHLRLLSHRRRLVGAGQRESSCRRVLLLRARRAPGRAASSGFALRYERAMPSSRPAMMASIVVDGRRGTWSPQCPGTPSTCAAADDDEVVAVGDPRRPRSGRSPLARPAARGALVTHRALRRLGCAGSRTHLVLPRHRVVHDLDACVSELSVGLDSAPRRTTGRSSPCGRAAPERGAGFALARSQSQSGRA